MILKVMYLSCLQMAKHFDPLALLFLNTNDVETLLFAASDDSRRNATFNSGEHLKYAKYNLATLSEDKCRVCNFKF